MRSTNLKFYGIDINMRYDLSSYIELRMDNNCIHKNLS